MEIEDMWKQIMNDIHKKGHFHYKDDAKIKEILNISGWIDSPLKIIFPHYKNISKKTFLSYIEQGFLDIKHYNMKGKALHDYVQSFDDNAMIYVNKADDFVYTYPQRLLNIHLCSKNDMPMFYDQIEVICNRLKQNKGSNRAVATLYSAGLDKDEEHIPCLNWLQALIRDDALYLSVMFRSNDIYNAFPSNMLFIAYIGMSIVESLKEEYPNLYFDGIYYQCSSAHYYVQEMNDKIIKEIIGD